MLLLVAAVAKVTPASVIHVKKGGDWTTISQPAQVWGSPYVLQNTSPPLMIVLIRVIVIVGPFPTAFFMIAFLSPFLLLSSLRLYVATLR